MKYETDKCIHCGKEKGKHQAGTFNCPIKVSYARNFAGFESDKFFEPKMTTRKPKQKFTLDDKDV